LPEYQHTVSKSHIYLLHPTAYSEIWARLHFDYFLNHVFFFAPF
jgi:hypothetical protein